MDTQTTPFRHRTTTWYLAWPGTLLASGFHPGQASLSFLRLRVTGSRPCLFFPGLDLRAVVDLSRPYDCPDLSVFDLDVPVHWARGASDFILGTPGLTLVVVTSLPDDDLLGL